MEPRYIRIEAAKPSRPEGSPSPGTETTTLAPKRRRMGVTLACDVCRRKKIRCEGGRPSCASCVKSVEICNYSQRGLIEAENARGATTLQVLRSLPRPEAHDLLEKIRNHDDNKALQASPSLASVLWTHLASSQSRIEFELTIRHPVSYPPLFPLDINSLPLETLLRPSRVLVTRSEPEERSQPDGTFTTVATRYLPDRPLVDERLRSIQMQNWTRVPISNDLAAHILSLYIETDYQILPLFNLDLFLEDLVQDRSYFCSKLLVNALFSWICQMYSAFNPQAHLKGRAFFAEAQNLILDGPERITLTSVSALAFLSLAALSHGEDRLGLAYLRQGVALGTDMGLFGRSYPNETATAWLGNLDAWNRSASYTAWGVHNWASLYSFRYQSIEITDPPKLPMPGALQVGPPSERLNTGLASIHVQVFKACCELWLICYDVRALRHYIVSKECPYPPRHVEKVFVRCLTWASNLPLDLVRSDTNSHAVAMMHIYHHVIIADVFREFSHKTNDDPFTWSFETTMIKPRDIYVASINQLKRLLLVISMTFPMARLSVLSHTVITYVANACIEEADDQESVGWTFYLRLCFTALEDLYGNYREAWSAAKGLLSLALMKGAIGSDDARMVMKELSDLGSHHDCPSEAESLFLMDLELAITDPLAAQTNTLADQFDDLLLKAKVKGTLVAPPKVEQSNGESGQS